LHQELPFEQVSTSKLYFDWLQLYQFDPGIKSWGLAEATELFGACPKNCKFRFLPDYEVLLASRLELDTSWKPRPSDPKIAKLLRAAWALGKRNYFLSW
jgi:hypothetical protein